MKELCLKAVFDIAPPLIVAAFWGSAFVAIKVGLADLSPTALVSLRFLLAAAGFLALYAVGLIRFEPIAREDLARFGLIVTLGIFVYHLALATAETTLPASVACLIGQTTALFVLAFTATSAGNFDAALTGASPGGCGPSPAPRGCTAPL